MRQELHGDDELRVDFRLDEDSGDTWVEIQSAADGPDLSDTDDVVVALKGKVADIDVAEPDMAKVYLGVWDDIQEPGMELMIRVGEWFNSWELG